MTGAAPEPDLEYRRYAAQLAEALVSALPGWVECCVAGVYRRQGGADGRPLPPELAQCAAAAGRRAADEVGPVLRELLGRDVDDQPTTPLALVRSAVRYPTQVLADAGVAVPERDEFAARAFPTDLYDLSPASFADIDPELADIGIAWGAAKAFVHKRRHRSG